MNPTTHFLNRLTDQPDAIQFSEFTDLIEHCYHFTPTAFTNGSATNSANQNQGSAKVFAFGRLHRLSEPQTLACFGEHYRSVLSDPEGQDHQNIRQFMQHGWSGVTLDNDCLTAK